MITEDDLKAAGYSFYKSNAWRVPKGDGLYQKWILDSDGKRTFALCFYLWDLRKIDSAGKLEFSAEARLYKDIYPYYSWENRMGGDGETNFDLVLHLNREIVSVSEVEMFFINAYQALGCCPDVHNND